MKSFVKLTSSVEITMEVMARMGKVLHVKTNCVGRYKVECNLNFALSLTNVIPGKRIMDSTWFGEIFSCCCLHVLPGSAWVLLN